MILDAFKTLAPDLPSYQARFRPIYFEPVVGSGERFTIAIMAQGRAGDSRIIQTLVPRKIQCMYGEHARTVSNLVMLVIESANKYLEAGADMAEWQPPVSGIYLGPVQTSRSNAEMEGILFQALTSYASLYSGDIVDRALNEINHVQIEQEDIEQLTSSLLQQIKAMTISTSPRFVHHWQREVMVKNNGRVSIDYLGIKYNANLSNFDVKHVKNAFKTAKAKLFDLDVLRQQRKSEAVECAQQFELLVALKSNASAEAEDNFYNLEQLADSIELRVVKKATPEELAARIIQQEAA